MQSVIPPNIILDNLLKNWLLEDIGRGDRTTAGLFSTDQVITGAGYWLVKESGVIAGLPIAARVFQLLDEKVNFLPTVTEGEWCESGTVIAKLDGPLDSLLTGERVALNLGMRLSGIATMTRKYADKIADLSVQLVDTRKTTPGLRILEKYATQVGGAKNHRMGLDDAVMIKDNHIAAAGGIGKAIAKVRETIPYPLTIEVETETLAEVETALEYQADIIMLDNMSVEVMQQAVKMIRQNNSRIKIEASGNITLDTIRNVAETGVDYVSTSAPITRSTWLDLSMKIEKNITNIAGGGRGLE
ncbi:MAG: carboxylating nicotinate-nucleotide diphosphorylase [Okeania sp. SIO2G4]|uniref:carboxylating nicotinate-nucleotide diphosphorylase n=1 Tax=unclassified Okeania TaxID=2634635 RepID=UPI0013B86452|nr:MULTISPECIES: carboxylating nicotinate-nucleotide diphosphorylase [unclassified Okeania]NEP75504.1 carboxylating nicotinate-nucleotide diphosphorylase [Okeania sp. SIO2G5]NEP96625.1 carboxylating nicotinate-nucleotide diphosphorylase [Okeania sp. SIO2F5]NEQ94351.1 carboxylating nicotinate-nucleotide diphosphorylase [Okeania sp. SIO2G4]